MAQYELTIDDEMLHGLFQETRDWRSFWRQC